ncbi:SCF E2 ubiquitin-protein ligase catalytic subunit CDC34 [Saccharomyces cerevisiae]|uniref:Cdc34p n=1 Tax=Saccharomyces cerevisiae (strain CEN.PK113-7D) TaxID=889517 RepID=N1P4K6_YEASC
MSSRKSTASSLLLRQYRELTDPKKAIPSFHIELEDDSNIFTWNIGVMVLNEDSIYHGGFFKAQMRFPEDFPFSPPQFRFTPAIYHPNVYRDGRLCISILHQSGDPMTDEPDAETWSPVQTVESVLISIVSLLEDPNINSPANVDAAVDYRKNPEQYKQRVKMEVERSKQDIPKGFIMPTSESAYISQSKLDEPESNKDMADNFWYDSDLDDDENGSVIFQDDDYDDGNNHIPFEDDDVYNYNDNDDDDERIEFEDDDDDDDDSIDNDSVMDRKQPHKAEDESEDVEDVERVSKKI